MGEIPSVTDQDAAPILDFAEGLLGLEMVASGVVKLFGAENRVESFERWGYPQWFCVTTGMTAMLGGLGLLTRSRSRSASVLGGTLIDGTMIDALDTHLLRVGDPPLEAAQPGLLLTVASLVTGRELRGRLGNDRERTDD